MDKQGFTFERDPVTGFVIGGTDTRFKDSPPYRSTVEYNPPMQADPFAYVPPADMKVVDDRDIMHKRGWTCYRVTGQLGGEAITGTGQIPFTYAASLTKPVWLRLRIGQRFVLTDDGRQALVRDQAGAVRLALAGGSFLKGLSRPWGGFHTFDTIRRDAVGSGCRYTTTLAEAPQMIIRVLRDEESSTWAQSNGEAEYIINMDTDLLESVRYWQKTEREPVGELHFTYLENMDGAGEAFAAPETTGASPSGVLSGGTPLWPLELLTQLGL